MIVRNEGHQLAEALSNIRAFADEIVVVDTGSTDDTKAVAQQFTPMVYDFPWCDDFSAARNQSFERATGRYVLWMDADDRVPDEMCDRLCRLKASLDDNQTAFYFILQDMDSQGATCSFYQLRCVPRREDVRFSGRIHEQLKVDGLVPVMTDVVVQHFGYMHRTVYSQKLLRNKSILEKERDEGRDDMFINFHLALISETLGRMEDAIGYMKTALSQLERQALNLQSQTAIDQQSRSIMEAHLHLARFYCQSGQQQQALRHTALVHALAVEDASLYFRLGHLYQHLYQHAKAIACLVKARQRKTVLGLHPNPCVPAEEKILMHIVYNLLCMKRSEDAMACMREAWRLGLEVTEGWELLGLIAAENSHVAIGIQAYEAALGTGPLSSDGYNILGKLYGLRGATRKARKCFEEALARDPRHERVRFNLAVLLLDLNEWQQSKVLLQRLVEEGHGDAESLVALALIALEQKDLAEFCAVERMLQSDPSLAVSALEGDHAAFFEEVARQLDVQRRPGPAAWARRIATNLRQKERAK